MTHLLLDPVSHELLPSPEEKKRVFKDQISDINIYENTVYCNDYVIFDACIIHVQLS